MREVSGFLLIDKPKGMRSSRLLGELRNSGNIDKAGHAGTLDTNASGLMIVAINKAVKLFPLFARLDKEYAAEISFHKPVTESDMLRSIQHFTGKISQLPPRRSAVSRKPRIRSVHRITLLSFSPRKASLRISCSAGFYVRRLASDIGSFLETQAHLSNLRRVKIGSIPVEYALPPGKISMKNLLSMESAVEMARVKRIEVLPESIPHIMKGSPVKSRWIVRADHIKKGETVCVFSESRLIAVAISYAETKDFPRMRLAARTDTVLKQ